MVRLILAWVNKPWVYELRPGLNSFGRNPTNDIRLSDASISSFHCELMVSKEAIVVRDVGSSNGTFVDGQMVKEEAAIKPGQTLRMGLAEFRLEETEIEVAVPRPAPKHPDSEPEAKEMSMLGRLSQTIKIAFRR